MDQSCAFCGSCCVSFALLVSLSVVCEMCVPERAKRSCVYVACGALPDWLCLTSSM